MQLEVGRDGKPKRYLIGRRQIRDQEGGIPARLARDSYVLAGAYFLMLLALTRLFGFSLMTAALMGALLAGWSSSWSP